MSFYPIESADIIFPRPHSLGYVNKEEKQFQRGYYILMKDYIFPFEYMNHAPYDQINRVKYSAKNGNFNKKQKCETVPVMLF